MYRLAEIWCYPIKSCQGIQLPRAELSARGLLFDRLWMLVDKAGDMVTQRSHPSLANIQTRLTDDELLVDAPGQQTLRIALVPSEPLPNRDVTCWDDTCAAGDEGDSAAEWFSAVVENRPKRRFALCASPIMASALLSHHAVKTPCPMAPPPSATVIHYSSLAKPA